MVTEDMPDTVQLLGSAQRAMSGLLKVECSP